MGTDAHSVSVTEPEEETFLCEKVAHAVRLIAVYRTALILRLEVDCGGTQLHRQYRFDPPGVGCGFEFPFEA